MTLGKRPLVRRHTELEVYKLGFELAMRLFHTSKAFPIEETIFVDRSDAEILKIGLCESG